MPNGKEETQKTTDMHTMKMMVIATGTAPFKLARAISHAYFKQTA